MNTPVRIGLIGAGPWASMVHAPVFAAGPDTVLSAVWARRPDAAQKLATKHGAKAVDSIDALFAACEAVAFCVPPAVQAELAIAAARAGKALILEKPIAADLESAQRLTTIAGECAVPSIVALTWRFTERVRQFLGEAAAFAPFGARGTFVAGGLLRGPFRTPWRLEHGPLLDLGPHIIDLLDAALGPVTGVLAGGRLDRWVSLLLSHQSGVVSNIALCAHAPITPHLANVELFSENGVLAVDCGSAVTPAAFATLREEVVAMTRSGRSHALDVQRGLRLQRVIAEATAQLR